MPPQRPSPRRYRSSILLMLHLGKKLGVMDKEAVRARIGEMRKIPHKIQLVLDGAGNMEELARKYMHFKNFLYLGRGINYPVALEGALKLKEISYIHAEAYAAGEMKHGPIALIDENMPVVFVSPNDQTYKKTCSNVEEVVVEAGEHHPLHGPGDATRWRPRRRPSCACRRRPMTCSPWSSSCPCSCSRTT